MRRLFVATLVLIPALVHAQTSSPTGPKPSPAATTLVAKATAPASPAARQFAASSIATPAALHETVTQHVEALYLDGPATGDATIGYTLYNGEPTDVSPKLVHVVETQLPQSELTSPVVVTVRMSVDDKGVPQNLVIEKSAGAAVDEKTIEAVKEFRFKPATVNRRAVQSEVTVDIKVEKQ